MQTFSLISSIRKSGSPLPGMHFAVPRQGSDRQHSLPGGFVHVCSAVLAAPRHHKFAVFLRSAVHDNPAKHLRRSGMPRMPVGVGRDYDGVPVFEQSGASLSAAGMPDDAQAERCQGLALRDCLRHRGVTFIGRQITVLLLAHVQCESLRSSRTVVQVHKLVSQCAAPSVRMS